MCSHLFDTGEHSHKPQGGLFTPLQFVLSIFVLCYRRCSPVLLQAISEVNRKQWIEAMDGKEPVGLTSSLLTLHVYGHVSDPLLSVPDISFSHSKAG